jgi:hypothetical protein
MSWMIDLDSQGRFFLFGSLPYGIHCSIILKNALFHFFQHSSTSSLTMIVEDSTCDRRSLASSKSACLYRHIFLGTREFGLLE